MFKSGKCGREQKKNKRMFNYYCKALYFSHTTAFTVPTISVFPTAIEYYGKLK
jgi:hypothetical protein